MDFQVLFLCAQHSHFRVWLMILEALLNMDVSVNVCVLTTSICVLSTKYVIIVAAKSNFNY